MDRPNRDYTTDFTTSGAKDEAPTTSTGRPEGGRSRPATRDWNDSLTASIKRLAENPDELAKIEARGF